MGGSWEHFWSPFSRSLEKWPKCKNDQHSITFGGFLGVGASSGGFWRLSWEGFGSYVGRCWLQDGVFFGYLGRCCGILVPRWRTGAPRRGKIGELRRRGLLLGGRNPCGGPPRTPLHPPKNGFSRMGLQTPTPTGTGSGKLEDWRTGRLENWKTGELVTGPSALHCTRNCA